MVVEPQGFSSTHAVPFAKNGLWRNREYKNSLWTDLLFFSQLDITE